MFCKNCGQELAEDAVFCLKCGTKININQSVVQEKPISKQTKYCSNCASVIDEKAEICPKCGVRVSIPSVYPEKRNPGIAAILSLVIPGSGQMYCGYVNRGIIILISTLILVWVLIGIILWVWNIYDAYQIAENVNRGEPNTDRDEWKKFSNLLRYGRWTDK